MHAESTAEQRTGLPWRQVVPLCLTTFIGIMNVLTLIPFFTEIAADIDTTVPLVGQVITAAILVGAIAGLVVGPIADHYGHRRVIIIGMFLTAFSALGTAVAISFPMLLAARLVGGFGMSMCAGVTFAAAALRFDGDQRRRVLSLLTASMSVAAIFGTPLLTTIAAATSWRGANFFVFGLALATIALVIIGMPHDGDMPDDRLKLREILNAYRPLAGDRGMLGLYSGSLLRQICWIGPFTYFGAFLVTQYDFSAQQVGFTMIIGGGGYFLGSVAAGGRLGRFDLRMIFALSNVVMGIFWGLVYALPTAVPVMLLGIGVLAFVGGVGLVGMTTLLAAETPARAGTTMVLNTSVQNLGGAVGAAIGGLLLSLGGYTAVGIGLPFFAFVAAVIVWQPVEVRWQVLSDS